MLVTFKALNDKNHLHKKMNKIQRDTKNNCKSSKSIFTQTVKRFNFLALKNKKRRPKEGIGFYRISMFTIRGFSFVFVFEAQNDLKFFMMTTSTTATFDYDDDERENINTNPMIIREFSCYRNVCQPLPFAYE